jgi:hypothetical protein
MIKLYDAAGDTIGDLQKVYKSYADEMRASGISRSDIVHQFARIDDKIVFRDDTKAAKPEQIIIQVKGGKTGVKDVYDLPHGPQAAVVPFGEPVYSEASRCFARRAYFA